MARSTVHSAPSWLAFFPFFIPVFFQSDRTIRKSLFTEHQRTYQIYVSQSNVLIIKKQIKQLEMWYALLPILSILFTPCCFIIGHFISLFYFLFLQLGYILQCWLIHESSTHATNMTEKRSNYHPCFKTSWMSMPFCLEFHGFSREQNAMNSSE